MDSSYSDTKIIAIIAGISVIAVFVFMAYFALTTEPVTFSEVWIDGFNEDSSGLVEFSFGIGNQELQEAEYRYTIKIEDSLMAEGSVIVNTGESKIVNETVQLPDNNVKQRIVINVANIETQEEYSLWFWGGGE